MLSMPAPFPRHQIGAEDVEPSSSLSGDRSVLRVTVIHKMSTCPPKSTVVESHGLTQSRGGVLQRSGCATSRTRVARRRPPRGAAHIAYSPYLLSGVLRCGVCGARMVAQTATRKKGDEVYRYSWYRCGGARDKGPAVCAHHTGYRRDRLERALLAKFREAMTPAMVETLATAINAHIEAVFRGHDARVVHITGEIRRLEHEAGNLVRFLVTGGDSAAVRGELRQIESELEQRRAESATLERAASLPVPRVHPAWVRAKLDRLDELMRQDPARARVEILKHLDGDLAIAPLPSGAGERRAEVTGRVKSHSLLSTQEAVCLQVVAGVGFEPKTFGLSG